MTNSALIDMIVMAAGETRLTAYIEETFPAETITSGTYTLDTAAEWLDIEAFTRWLNHGNNRGSTNKSRAAESIDASRGPSTRPDDAHSTRRSSDARSSRDGVEH